MKNLEENWTEIVYQLGEQSLGLDALRKLTENQYAAIVIKNVLDKEKLENAIEAARINLGKALKAHYFHDAPYSTIGCYLTKYLNRPEEYFIEAQSNEPLLSKHIEIFGHVRQQVQDILKLRNLDVAKEPDGRRYAPFTVMIISEHGMGPLHNDNIMRDSKSIGLLLANLKYQLACVVCLQECDGGGNLRVYKKNWTLDDEKYKTKHGFGYDDAVVKEKPCFVFKPQAGDIYLFNSINYHEVDQTSGQERIVLRFFIGFFDENLEDGVIWS